MRESTLMRRPLGRGPLIGPHSDLPEAEAEESPFIGLVR